MSAVGCQIEEDVLKAIMFCKYFITNYTNLGLNGFVRTEDDDDYYRQKHMPN